MMMVTYSVKNDSPVDKAFRVHGGHKIISAGQKGEVTVIEPYADEQIEAFARDDVELKIKKGEKASDGLKAEHLGGGKFRITKGEEVLLSDLSKADADAFNALSAEDREAFVTDKTKGT